MQRTQYTDNISGCHEKRFDNNPLPVNFNSKYQRDNRGPLFNESKRGD